MFFFFDEDKMEENIEQSEVLLYATEDSKVHVSVVFYDETFWLTQKAMAELFGVDVSTINEHLKNIFSSGELDPDSTIGNFPIVQNGCLCCHI